MRKTCVRQPSSTDSECCQPKHCTSGRCRHNIANWPHDCVPPTFSLPTTQTASTITVCAETQTECFVVMTYNGSLQLASSFMQLHGYEPSNTWHWTVTYNQIAWHEKSAARHFCDSSKTIQTNVLKNYFFDLFIYYQESCDLSLKRNDVK